MEIDVLPACCANKGPVPQLEVYQVPPVQVACGELEVFLAGHVADIALRTFGEREGWFARAMDAGG